MKKIYRLEDCKIVKNLFEGLDDSLILSCIQGVMGSIYVDDLDKPKSAMAVLGEFCFFAGKPNEDLVMYKPSDYKGSSIIAIPQNEKWGILIEKCYKNNVKKKLRYGIKKEGDIFDRDSLRKNIASLSKKYELRLVDYELFLKCRDISWCRDIVAYYDSFDKYQKYGLGVVIMDDNEIVSAAGSYSGYDKGIEVSISTREDYRRLGLATVAGSKLILECLKRGIYPNWDAKTKLSVELAKKLGYNFDCEYLTYEICKY